jgi:dTDP-4-dehydrorhamnose reductase
MKVMITGHLGFVGKATVEDAPKDVEIVGFDILEGNDIRNKDRLMEFIRDEAPDYAETGHYSGQKEPTTAREKS